MLIRWLPGHPRYPEAKHDLRGIYIGTLASTKLDKSAVKRNRMRRRCREALRTTLPAYETLPTTQLLIVPRSSSLTAPFAAIQQDIQTFLSFRHHARNNEAR